MSNRVAANLVIAVDGATTLGGGSSGLSAPADRARFHQLRSEFKAILIGGNTARSEPYAKTPIPLIVLTHLPLTGAVTANPLAIAWNISLPDAVALALTNYGDLLIEAGPVLLRSAMASHLLSEIYITLSDRRGGENPVELAEFIQGGVEISRQPFDGGVFLHYRLAPSHL